jgi:hypothetical protein
LDAHSELILPTPIEPLYCWRDGVVASIRAPYSITINDSSLPVRLPLAGIPAIGDLGGSIGPLVSVNIAVLVNCFQGQMNSLNWWQHGWRSRKALRSQNALFDSTHVWSPKW